MVSGVGAMAEDIWAQVLVIHTTAAMHSHTMATAAIPDMDMVVVATAIHTDISKS